MSYPTFSRTLVFPEVLSTNNTLEHLLGWADRMKVFLELMEHYHCIELTWEFTFLTLPMVFGFNVRHSDSQVWELQVEGISTGDQLQIACAAVREVFLPPSWFDEDSFHPFQ